MPQDHTRGWVVLPFEIEGTQVLDQTGEDWAENIYPDDDGTFIHMSEDGDTLHRFAAGTTPKEIGMYLAGRADESREQSARDREQRTQDTRQLKTGPQLPTLDRPTRAADPLGLREWPTMPPVIAGRDTDNDHER